ncbi:hypothetical protein MXB_2867 [Myxobolus squamalis]|nr:hypothetical protein MXB_2867 [Myxobolus squamalis]
MLISPHKSLNLKFDGDVEITSGKYAYYHYGCQSCHDSVFPPFVIIRAGVVLIALFKRYFRGLYLMALHHCQLYLQ